MENAQTRGPDPSDAPVRAAMARARRAFPGWSATPLRHRLDLMRALRSVIVHDLDEVLDTLIEATNKPALEALSSDVLVTLEAARYYERHATRILKAERRPTWALARGSRFLVEYQPFGVVAIISPWNHPLQLSLLPAIPALVAGNVVLLKPSELTPTVGSLIARLFREAGFPDGVLQLVPSERSAGAALVEARPDKVFFTGSTDTGRKVMQAAAEAITPVELELGGKDPMIVFADADLARAASAAVYGAFANAGQSCVAIERLYVETPVYDELLERILDEVLRLRPGTRGAGDYGPLIRPAQREVVEEQIADALGKGARLENPLVVEGELIHPVVLTGVDHSMKVMQEETFGPVLPVMRFSGEDEAVALANDSRYGLNASVWTADEQRGLRVARRLVTGSCAINEVLRNVANPAMPFGGEKQSGFCRYHGPEGLRAFCRQRAIQIGPGRRGREPGWLPFDRASYEGLRAWILAVHGRGLRGRTRSLEAAVRAAALWMRERRERER